MCTSVPGSDEHIPAEDLFGVLYPELRRLAQRAMRGERQGHTLQATALVNEAWLRLSPGIAGVEGKPHFLALAARTMRRILIDHSRGRDRLKRGSEMVRITLADQLAVEGSPGSDAMIDLIALDDALVALAAFDPRRARLLELQFFGGLTYPEMAEALEISEATVHRELRLARAWLHRELSEPNDDATGRPLA